ncbi:MAG: hypothetical protein HQK79_01905 [Desulfobacterales bacterium]|nr:hypothetical protein [Desulfobacterales bacterium]MBF0398403.1 hypothetical protein [Desulfobacterales bacterium]
MKNIIMFISLFTSLFLNACATDITTRASLVRLVSPEQAHDLESRCNFIANVRGWSYLWFTPKVAYNNALHEILDNAAEVGATHLFVNLGNYRNFIGEAYFCAICQRSDGRMDIDRCQDAKGKSFDAMSQEDCEAKNNVWIPKAKDKISCEAKGGKWISDEDTLRRLYEITDSKKGKK